MKGMQLEKGSYGGEDCRHILVLLGWGGTAFSHQWGDIRGGIGDRLQGL